MNYHVETPLLILGGALVMVIGVLWFYWTLSVYTSSNKEVSWNWIKINAVITLLALLATGFLQL